MKIASVDLTRRTSDNWNFRSNRPHVRICHDWLYDTFRLPKGLLAITFAVHDRPTADRFAFSLHSHAQYVMSRKSKRRSAWLLCFECFTNWLRRKRLKPGKIYYAEVRYDA